MAGSVVQQAAVDNCTSVGEKTDGDCGSALLQDVLLEASLLLVDDLALAVHVVLLQQVAHDGLEALGVGGQQLVERTAVQG
eukprot:scaffold140286_cov50-Prasinocladus_malaysianus.AAC.1